MTVTWDVLDILGAIAFGISGTLVASEENYDLLGAYILGFTTAFGGGTIRNLLLGVSVEGIWMQKNLFIIAFVSITFAFFFPHKWKPRFKHSAVFFDAVGLAAFAIQGSNYAVSIEAPVIAVVVAAVMTGVGGGLVRDLLAGRKPMIFYSEIYALWAALAGLFIGLDWISGPYVVTILFIALIILRVASVYYKWTLPHYFSAQKRFGFD
ncbi:trimeric intracellular cation channel family protein [Alkalibacterium sp. f15]|uniref:trimeric intracellular cation channel family protein n=1 Tax=Alkalibacterium sp. f15 TaxID=3414029 RepID=UPI003BF84F8A